MTINETSGADKNIINHSNRTESIELIDSYDTSFTISVDERRNTSREYKMARLTIRQNKLIN